MSWRNDSWTQFPGTFDVSMNDLLLVQISHCDKDLTHNYNRETFFDRACFHLEKSTKVDAFTSIGKS